MPTYAEGQPVEFKREPWRDWEPGTYVAADKNILGWHMVKDHRFGDRFFLPSRRLRPRDRDRRT